MSLRVDKDFLSIRDVNSIKDDCFVIGKNNDYGPNNTLHAYGETKSAIYIPFSYAKQRFQHFPNMNINYPKTNYPFYSEKYPFKINSGRDQQIVYEQSIKLIQEHHSVLLSLFCGYGKCLAKDTPILLFNGRIKKVQDIEIGDLLMGDDSSPRKVMTLAQGREEMYKIVQQDAESYTVNKSHILSLKKNSGEIIDISIKEYINLSDIEKGLLYGYRVAIEFESHKVNIHPFTLGYWLTSTRKCFPNSLKKELQRYNILDAKRIPQIYKSNSRRVRKELLTGLLSTQSKSINYTIIKLDSEILANDIIFVSRSLGLTSYIYNYNEIYISASIENGKLCLVKSLNSPISIKYKGISDYYGFTIDNNHRFLLGDFTVTHNTYTAIRLAHNYALKTAVLAHRDILFGQWEESINKFTGAKVQRVDTTGILDPNADFYIFNTAYVHKKWDKSTKSWVMKKTGIYKNIGLLIVDEAHVACAQDMSRSLLYFNPLIVIALTATPVRKDGMDKMLELYFGEYSKTRIIRMAQTPFIVYRLLTDIKPEFTTTKLGKKDWNSVIKYLVENKRRNNIIIKLVKQFSEYNILILTKRKIHCKVLAEKLNKLQITNTIMIGTQKTYDQNARVLLSTYSKLGVGFDDTRLNMLIIACSITEVEQYAGRLRVNEDKERIIIDMVDDDGNCKNHWRERRKWYLSRNGEIKNYYSVFPKKTDHETKPKGETEKPIRLARRI
jgi:hypothetical protein